MATLRSNTLVKIIIPVVALGAVAIGSVPAVTNVFSRRLR